MKKREKRQERKGKRKRKEEGKKPKVILVNKNYREDAVQVQGTEAWGAWFW